MNRTPYIKAIRRTFSDNNMPMPPQLQIRWSNRMTSALGSARVKQHAGTLRSDSDLTITLSLPLFKKATEAKRINTCVHEAAHLIGYLWGASLGHNEAWRQAMRNAGEEPSVYHDVQPIARTLQRRVANCQCGRHYITPAKAAKVLKGYRFSCNMCRTYITYTGHSVRRLSTQPRYERTLTEVKKK